MTPAQLSSIQRCYLDTSAALKLIVDEGPTSDQLARYVDESDLALVGTRLLETELRRCAHRIPELHQDTVTAFLSTIDLHSVSDSVFRQAGLMYGPVLRSLDALHLASAIALDVGTLLTYDLRLAEAAQAVGLTVRSPA